jgi:uncharacterized membrane protein
MATTLSERTRSGPAGADGGGRDRLATALGWASLGLGLPQVVRPGDVTTAIGIGAGPRHRAAALLVGARELAAAAGLLAGPARLFLWARVAGDAMDLGMLARALRRHDGRGLRRTVAATAAVAGIALVDLYAALRRTRREALMNLTATTTVLKSPEELYEFWRRFDRLPTFMAHLDEVRVTGERTSHWIATAPFGRTVEWDAEIVDEAPGSSISWRSTDDADVANQGTVRFVRAPGDRGTEVHVELEYKVPGGGLGEAVARYFGEDPHQQLDDDLRRFKQVIETGEPIRSDGAPGGKRARKEFPQHPAQPLTDEEYLQEVTA